MGYLSIQSAGLSIHKNSPMSKSPMKAPRFGNTVFWASVNDGIFHDQITQSKVLF